MAYNEEVMSINKCLERFTLASNKVRFQRHKGFLTNLKNLGNEGVHFDV